LLQDARILVADSNERNANLSLPDSRDEIRMPTLHEGTDHKRLKSLEAIHPAPCMSGGYCRVTRGVRHDTTGRFTSWPWRRPWATATGAGRRGIAG
jgi:hypothetical protein